MLGGATHHLDRHLSIRQAVILLTALVANRSLAQTPTTAQSSPVAPVNTTAMQVLDNSTVSEEPPSKEQCIAAHRECQEAQNEGRLITAREKAAICTNHTCPGLLISDCARWKNEIDRRVPSVVFEVRLDGQRNTFAKINVDGTTVDTMHPGEVLRLEPGKHTFQFMLEPHAPIVRTLVLGEGMQYRIVSAEFKSEAVPAAQAEVPAAQTAAPTVTTATPPAVLTTSKPVPMLVNPLLGVGALGLGGFIGFVLSGRSEYNRLANTCSPNCSDNQIGPLRARYLMGDISFGLGLSALIGAGTVYLTRPIHAVDPTVGIETLPHGAMATLAVRGF